MKNLTQNLFVYDNKRYSLFISLFSTDSSGKTTLEAGVDLTSVEEIVYENQLNDFLLKGHVICVDSYASLDKFLDQQFVYLTMLFTENLVKTDTGVVIDIIDDANAIKHAFIVQNIKIIERIGNNIKYRLDFISANWFKCVANLTYSNYQKSPESIFDIFKNCLIKQGLTINPDSFDLVKTNVKMNYITTQNTNLMSATKYLFHKLYYFNTYEESMKFFTYNEFTDKYSLFDVRNAETAQEIDCVMMSFFKSNLEMMASQEPNRLGSFLTPIGKTECYKNFFEYRMNDYNQSTNKFTTNVISEKSLVDYANNMIDNSLYHGKYITRPPNDLDLHYYQAGSYWNNTQNLYNTIFDSLNKTDSFILNTSGNIHRRPGGFINITLDRNMSFAKTDDASELAEMKKKYKTFEGVFLTTKVQTIIRPTIPTYRQQIVLCRNFVLK